MPPARTPAAAPRVPPRACPKRRSIPGLPARIADRGSWCASVSGSGTDGTVPRGRPVAGRNDRGRMVVGDDEANKLIGLALRNVVADWHVQPKGWRDTMDQFAIF